MISSLDQAIGEILESVEAEENDLGARTPSSSLPVTTAALRQSPGGLELLIPPMRDGFSSNGELKQGKGSVFEGGIRSAGSDLVAWQNSVGASLL